MKTIATLMLFCASLYAADPDTDETSEVTSRVLERDYEHGATHMRVETLYRGKRCILIIHQTTKAGITKTSRGYNVGGDLVMVESDEDGDGNFETLCIFNTKNKEIEVFTRQSNGSVKPVDAKTLAAFKEQNAVMEQFWRKAFDAETTPENFLESGKALNKKLSDLEKEKTKPTNENQR